MNRAQPIRNQSELVKFKNYYSIVERNNRNLLLITMGLNTALRISDILSLQWKDVYDLSKKQYYEHITIIEQKTQKHSKIFMNNNIQRMLEVYRKSLNVTEPDNESYLFKGKNEKPISRVQAYRIIKKAADACNISGTISPHSLRKTFGYHAWKSGVEPVMLMNIFNHSSFNITQRYLGIEQDDRDEVFKKVCI